MSWIFFALSVVALVLVANAHRPARTWYLIVPSFFSAWLTNEIAPWWIAVEIGAGVLLLRAGALDAPIGCVGLAITILSGAGLVHLTVLAGRTREVFSTALADLPELIPPARVHPAHVVLPLWLRDGRLERRKNIRYAPEFHRRHRLDIWRLKSGRADAPRLGAPVLLQIHGGAWVIGDKGQQGRPIMFELARRGWVCVAPNYRLSPAATFPDHLVDVKRALAWVKEHIDEYGGDPARVVVTGGSAGGHLAAHLALTANDPEFQPGFESSDTSVLGCVPMYGIYDFTSLFDPRRVKDQRIAEYLARLVMETAIADDPARYAAASPITRVHAAAPPFLVVHGTNDNLADVGQARAFVPALRAVSAEPVYYAELPAATHAFDVFHSIRTEHAVNGAVRFCEWAVNR